MARRLPMRSQLVAPVLARVAAAGGDAAALARRFDLPASAPADAEVVLPLPQLRALLDAAAAEARDPDLGLQLALAHPRGLYGLLEFSSRSAPTVREALARIARYVGLLNELVTVTVHERAGAATFEHRVPGEPLAIGRHGNEFVIATLLLQIRHLSGAPVVPARAFFAHPAPAAPAALLELLGTRRVRFDAGANGLELGAATLDLPLASSDPPLLTLLDRQAERSLAGLPVTRGILGPVRQRVRETLDQGPPSLAQVAAALRLSPRTLQRRLADEGARFEDVVDEVRRERALELVDDPRRPLGEIAFLLGFAELRSFLRAFKRWTGTTPAGHRRGAP